MRRILLLLILVLLIGTATVAVLAVDDMASVPPPAGPPTPEEAAQANRLVRNVRASLDSNEDHHTLLFKAHDLKGALTFAARRLPGTGVDVRTAPDGVLIAASLPLPANPLGRAVNVSVAVRPSTSHLDLSLVRVGGLDLPAGLVLPLLGAVLDRVLGDDLGERFVQSVHYVRVDGDRVTVAYTIDAGTLDVARDRLRERVDELAPLGNPTVVGEYYRHLMQRVRDGRLRNGISMAYFMREAFALAAHRGAAGDPVKENQAALLALSMYCGSWLVEKAIGTVRTADLADHKPACSQVTLSGRKDLRQHFILSAAIKLASDTGLATMVGEFKELLDTNAGGSGFSFSDLAADRAGVRLAEVATDPATARTLAALMARGPTEAGFFPSIAGLPDNLTETAFTQRFGTVESEPYRAMVADIDGRIARLAAYGGDAAGLRTLAALPMQPAAPAPVSVPRQNPTAPRASTLPNRAIGPANPNDDKALRRLLAQEAKLLQRFTDRHPDVLAVREAIRQRRKALGME